VGGRLTVRRCRRRSNHVGQQYRLLVQPDLAVVESSDIEITPNQARHVLDLPLGDFDRPVQRRITRADPAHDRQRMADRPERVGQFVSKRGEEFVAGSFAGRHTRPFASCIDHFFPGSCARREVSDMRETTR
jgi:hypothetical protein